MSTVSVNDAPLIFLIGVDSPTRKAIEDLAAKKSYRIEAFATVDEFLRQSTRSHRQGCVIFDLSSMPQDPFSALSRLREDASSMPVIAMSDQADLRSSVKSMSSGAMVLLKIPSDEEEFLDVIERALAWHRRICSKLQRIERFNACCRRLSSRQEIVTKLVLDGVPNKVIATRLKISERTVEMERAEILRVFAARNAVELAVMVTESRMTQDFLELDAHYFRLDHPQDPISSPHIFESLLANSKQPSDTDSIG